MFIIILFILSPILILVSPSSTESRKWSWPRQSARVCSQRWRSAREWGILWNVENPAGMGTDIAMEHAGLARYGIYYCRKSTEFVKKTWLW